MNFFFLFSTPTPTLTLISSLRSEKQRARERKNGGREGDAEIDKEKEKCDRCMYFSEICYISHSTFKLKHGLHMVIDLDLFVSKALMHLYISYK